MVVTNIAQSRYLALPGGGWRGDAIHDLDQTHLLVPTGACLRKPQKQARGDNPGLTCAHDPKSPRISRQGPCASVGCRQDHATCRISARVIYQLGPDQPNAAHTRPTDPDLNQMLDDASRIAKSGFSSTPAGNCLARGSIARSGAASYTAIRPL